MPGVGGSGPPRVGVCVSKFGRQKGMMWQYDTLTCIMNLINSYMAYNLFFFLTVELFG